MGLSDRHIQFFNKAIDKTVGSILGKSIVELGNNKFFGTQPTGKDFSTSKQYFESLGCNHVYLDGNNQDGSIMVNLAVPIEKQHPEFVNSFDILFNNNVSTCLMTSLEIFTQFGTKVVNEDSTDRIHMQYECWKNMHNLLKPGGLFIHILTRPGNYIGLTKHHKIIYASSFISNLVKSNKYKMVYESVMEARPEEIGSWYDMEGYCFTKTGKESFQPAKNKFSEWVFWVK